MSKINADDIKSIKASLDHIKEFIEEENYSTASRLLKQIIVRLERLHKEVRDQNKRVQTKLFT